MAKLYQAPFPSFLWWFFNSFIPITLSTYDAHVALLPENLLYLLSYEQWEPRNGKKKKGKGAGGNWKDYADKDLWRQKVGECTRRPGGNRSEGEGAGVGRGRWEGWVTAWWRNYSEVWLQLSVVMATRCWKTEGCCSLQHWTTCSQGNRMHPRHMVARHEVLGACQESSAQGRLHWLCHYTTSHPQCPHPSPPNLSLGTLFPVALLSVPEAPFGKGGNSTGLQWCRCKSRNWPLATGNSMNSKG